MCGTDICLGIIAIIFPPIAVWVKRGICSGDSLINLALCLLGFVPGLVHAWYIIAQYPDPTYDQLAQVEEGNADSHINGRGQRVVHVMQPGQQRVGGKAPANAGYGTLGSGAEAQSSRQGEVPPSYQDAVAGDHKVQQP